jgi:hypothetical protein
MPISSDIKGYGWEWLDFWMFYLTYLEFKRKSFNPFFSSSHSPQYSSRHFFLSLWFFFRYEIGSIVSWVYTENVQRVGLELGGKWSSDHHFIWFILNETLCLSSFLLIFYQYQYYLCNTRAQNRSCSNGLKPIQDQNVLRCQKGGDNTAIPISACPTSTTLQLHLYF